MLRAGSDCEASSVCEKTGCEFVSLYVGQDLESSREINFWDVVGD